MGHRKYPQVAYGDWRATQGYLYAVVTGLWPDVDGTLRLRIKLGSTRSGDPVAMCKRRYCTILGRTEILWLEPSADANRDERRVLHTHFKQRRVYPGRELFNFADHADFAEAISAFTLGLRRSTVAEMPYKPRPVAMAATATEMAAVNGPANNSAGKQLVNGLRNELHRIEAAKLAIDAQRLAAKVQRGKETLQNAQTRHPHGEDVLRGWVAAHFMVGKDKDFVPKRDLERALHAASIHVRPIQIKRCLEMLFSSAGVFCKVDHCAGGKKFPSAWLKLKWQ